MRRGGLPRSTSGTVLIVRTLGVTSSPRAPSPRVAPRTSRPSSYVSAMARPSIFGSHTMANVSVSSSAAVRLCHAASSWVSKAFARLSIGCGWTTSAKRSEGAEPTRCVGESGVTSEGSASSMARSSRTRASNSPSLMSGASSVW